MKKIKKLPISVVIVMYNEEKLLDRCIKSFIDYVDDLVIVDDGSNDRSVQIARKYTKKVYCLPHAGIAEHHRAFSYAHAKNEWILQIDGDEYLSPELAKHLEELIQQDVDMYDIPWPFYFRGRWFFSLSKRALFKKNQVYFIGASQEYVKPINKFVKMKRIPYPIYNDPSYEMVSFATFRRKQVPWAKMQAHDLMVPFAKLPKWNCTLVDWEPITKMRIQHPVLVGMLLSSLYHLGYNLRDCILQKSRYYLYQGIYHAMYFCITYYYVYQLQHGKKI